MKDFNQLKTDQSEVITKLLKEFIISAILITLALDKAVSKVEKETLDFNPITEATNAKTKRIIKTIPKILI